MVMIVEYLDTVFESSTRPAELLIGCDFPYTELALIEDDPIKPERKKAAIEAHEKFFADREITFKLYGPCLNTGWIVGGNVYWADCGDNQKVIVEYEQEFEVNGKSKEPKVYCAFFYSKSDWEKTHKPEWHRYKEIGSDNYFKEYYGENLNDY